MLSVAPQISPLVSDAPGQAASARAPFPLRQFFAAVFIALFCLIPFSECFRDPGPPMDEGALLLYPELVLKGQLPYRDFETFYGPGNLYTLAGIYSITGANIQAERAVGLAYRYLILFALFFIARRWGALIAAGCFALGALLLLPTSISAQTWLGGLPFALWSLILLSEKETKSRALAAGFLAGVALLFRPDFALGLALGVLPFLRAHSWPAKARFCLAALTCALPFGLLLTAVGWMQFYNNLILFPIFLSNPARHLPLLSADPDFLYLLALHLLACFLNVAAGLVALRADRRDTRARLLVASGLFALGLTHQVVQRIDLNHILSAGVVSIGLLPLSLFVLLATQTAGRASRSIALGTCAIVAVLIGFANPPVIAECRTDFALRFGFLESNLGFVSHAGRSFPVGRATATRAVAALVKKMDEAARPGERLIVGPADLRRTNYNDTFLYHLLPQLRPATYFLEMNPLSANRPGSRLAQDVASADWLILNRRWDYWDEPNQSKNFGSNLPNEIVHAHFELLGEYDSFLLFRRRPITAPASISKS